VDEAAPAESASDIAQQVRACLAGLSGDPRFYTTPVAMDDLDLVRVALGYEQINLYGVSYGTRAALTYLSGIERDAGLGSAASQARLALGDPQLVRSCIASLGSGADPDVVAAILSAGGPTAADAFIAAYIGATEATRPRLQQVLRSMGDAIASAASRRIREADTRSARELIDVLVGIGDKRNVPVLRQALEHLDVDVRKACLEALARMRSPESERLLVGALAHWDPETRCIAAHEIGQARAMSAVPAMLKILQGYYLFERNYGLKKELLESLEVLGSPAAVPTLRRMANRKFVLGRKNRELRYLARRALADLEQAGKADRRAS
jgi:HEAT repeat protein